MGHLLTVAKISHLNQEMRNTFYWGGGDATMANAQAIINEIGDAYRDEILANLNNNWTLYAFDVYDKTVPSVPAIEYIPSGAAITGLSSQDPMATQVACLVIFKAAVSPPNTNRKYLGGWIEQVMDTDGTFTSTIQTAALAWGQRLLDLPTVTGLGVVLEAVTLSSIDWTVVGGNPLETVRVNPIPATQQRRRLGVGI